MGLFGTAVWATHLISNVGSFTLALQAERVFSYSEERSAPQQPSEGSMRRTVIGHSEQLTQNVPVAGRDHLQGSIEAPILLLEYGDYQCPYCGEAHETVKTLQDRLGEKLCFAYRNFPLTNMHPYAEHAAEAAEAAAAQKHFWQMHDVLFENQDALEDDDLAGYAEALGLDGRRLLKQVQSGAHKARIREDYTLGVRGGVNGTPTFFINGVRYEGDGGVEALLAAIEEAGER
jgi:protein-disulfide isomerase